MNHMIVMWNDIDVYHALRDFTTDPVTFPGEEVRAFIQELVRWLCRFVRHYAYLLEGIQPSTLHPDC